MLESGGQQFSAYSERTEDVRLANIDNILGEDDI